MDVCRLIPRNTFLGRYLEWADHLETARRFDLFCGLWLLSATCGPHIRVDRPAAPLPVNLFTMFVAESGTARKSTAIGHALGVFHRVHAPCVLVNGRVSSEGLIQEAHGMVSTHNKVDMHMVSTEMVNLMSRKSYTADLVGLATELYDCPERTTGLMLAGRQLNLCKVYLTLLTASAPGWLARSINPDVLEAGFASRVLCVREEEPKGVKPWSEPPTPSDEFYTTAARQLLRLALLAGARSTIGLTNAALNKYITWYKQRTPGPTRYDRVFFSREQDHVLKIAALLCLNDGTSSIDRRHFLIARSIVTDCQTDGRQVFTSLSKVEHKQSDRLLSLVRDMAAYLIEMGGEWTAQHQLTYRFSNRARAATIGLVLETLLNLGAVQCAYTPKTRGRAARVWRGTTRLLEVSLEDVAVTVDAARAVPRRGSDRASSVVA